ncbi:hypothetical protein PYW07_000760 [Mythimna separata]|uniref:Uncharacterized protein n=1 Tax=Mythimna separata TaxID=271217 RepID=A0AAD7YT79_MYTSE|nr:hypothetical protein PYW07_000752 [Mythimna separata]KAJ8726055.1 hypothetical protein PYW07_000753 [Mythimna separata]KAJ8726056.1 hypothetical protein PYW07_000754 [Mythimna separata]KAJ8726057.1 hypothetical protein PYW07_000755 [Mythimna separata]KAJ8726058.1 hypothetical protein PYW07_000756 [Mythimna separata]
MPHYQYRNLLYLAVKEINLNAYTSRTGSARNITYRNLLYLAVKEINLNAYTSRTGSARNITVSTYC